MYRKCFCSPCPAQNGPRPFGVPHSSSNTSTEESSTSTSESSTSDSSSSDTTYLSDTNALTQPHATVHGQPNSAHYGLTTDEMTTNQGSTSTTRTHGSSASVEVTSSKYAKELLRATRSLKQKKTSDATLNTYCDSVLVGDWDTKSRAYEWNLVRYCQNRAASGLLVEKTSIRSAYLLKDVFVKRSSNFIMYDQQLQIVAPHLSLPSQKDKGVYLSATLSDCDEVILTRTSRSCQLSWSSHNLPCMRNVFLIQSVKELLTPREAVKYGEEFYITTLSDEDHELLYIEANYKVLGKFDNASNHSSIKFTPYKSGACVWKALAAKPEEREAKQGTPIYLDEYLHILNVRLGQKLAVEPSFMYQTLFGKEYEATAHNHMSLNGKERMENCIAFTANTRPTR